MPQANKQTPPPPLGKLLTFATLVIGGFFFNLLPTPYSLLPHGIAHAADIPFEELKPRLEVPVPALQFSNILKPDSEGYAYVSYLPEYISAVYSYLVGIAGIFAVAMIMYGGVKWIFAGGDSSKIGKARETILHAVIGLVLALGSYIILSTLNPDLVQFKSLRLLFVRREELKGQEEVVDPTEAIGPGGPARDYGQFDSRWAAHEYPYPSNCPEAEQAPIIRAQNPDKPCKSGSGTICSSGCGPTATANVLVSYGINVTPAEVADFMAQPGNGRECAGTAYDKFAFALSRSPWSNFVAERVTIDKATELLQQGKPIVFWCKNCTGTSAAGTPRTRAGHFMTLVGVRNGTYLVNDPGGRGRNKVVSMTRGELNANKGLFYLHPQ